MSISLQAADFRLRPNIIYIFRFSLFITAWLDTAVPMEEFIIPAYRHLKTMNPESVSIKALETDHYFSNARDALADSIMEWVKK